VAYEKGIPVGTSWFGRVLAVVMSAVVLVAAVMLSMVLFAVLLAVGVIVGGYVWWKLRALRRQARAFGDDGRTVDVEVVHKESSRDESMPR
jgi:hypothetical protein